MLLEIKFTTGTRMELEIPYQDMYTFTKEILFRNSGDWLFINGTAIPKDKVEFIRRSPSDVPIAQAEQLQ